MANLVNNHFISPSQILTPSALSNDDSSTDQETIEFSQQERINLINNILREISSIDKIESTDKFTDVLNEYGVEVNNKSDHYSHGIQNIIDKMEGTRDLIIQGKGDINKLISILTEQANLLNGLLRNKALHLRRTTAQAEAILAKGHVVQEGRASVDWDRQVMPSKDIEKVKENGNSYADVGLEFADIIKDAKSNEVDMYFNLAQKYAELYESFNINIQKAASDAVSAGDDGNTVAFDVNKMKAGYDNFQKDVDRLNSELGSVPRWDELTDEMKESRRKSLQPAYKVDDKGMISFEMDHYNSLSGTYPTGIKDGKVSTASYQAWLATFNSVGNTLQSNMVSSTQRYGQVDNSFQNFCKTLMSIFNSLADNLKECMRNM